MIRRSRIVFASLVLLAPVAVATIEASPAAAVDQDLTLSTTSGAPGTEVEVTSASCTPPAPGEEAFAFLDVRMRAGTAPDEVLIAVGSGDEGNPAVLLIPDWVDDTLPVTVSATCFRADFTQPDGEEEEFEYDEQSFDVLPGAGAPTQVATLSRTSLLAGQGFRVDAEACPTGDGASALTFVVAGDDRAARGQGESVGVGFAEVDPDGSFQTETILSNGGIEWVVSETEAGFDVEEINEVPTDIPPGTYTVLTYCSTDRGDDTPTVLLYEPQLIEVTGSAPVDMSDLTFDETSRVLRHAGTDAGSGPVDAFMLSSTFDGPTFGEPIPSEAMAARRSPFSRTLARRGARTGGHRLADLMALRKGSGSTRDLASDDEVDARVAVAPDGSWAWSQKAAFDEGLVEAYAAAGDPFADGFVYDPQVVEVKAAEVPASTTTTTTTAPPPPAAPPANAVPGTANFAG